MKILIVNKFLHPNGGSETYIFEVGKQLADMGHEVQYFGMEHEDRIVGNDAGCYTGNMDFHGGGLQGLLYPVKIIYSREAYRKITRVLESFDPDIVHVNNFNFQLTPSILYAIKAYGRKKGKKLPIVMTAHDSQLVCPNHLMEIPSTGEICFACRGGRFGNCSKNKCIHNSKAKSFLAAMEGYLYKWLKAYRQLDLLICPSDFLRQKLSTNPVLADKAVTIHNFVMTPGAEKLKNSGKGDYVLYFGRYSREKGIQTLLRVCEELKEIPFVFAGSGPMTEQVESLSNVENRGFLKGEELYKLIAGARLVVFPSECNENCPFSVMEAQMLGTPVLGSRLGGTVELIGEGKTGYLLEPGNMEKWVQKIRELWQDELKLKELTENCRDVKFYTVKQYCDILISNMQKCLEP